MKFTLWLEFEQVGNESQWSKEEEFANVAVQFTDGRYYGLKVWTYNFFKIAIETNIKDRVNVDGAYLQPPDLFVREMTRECIKSSIEDLLQIGNLEDVLHPSIFGIRFLEPWVDALRLPDLRDSFKEELHKEINEQHPLFGKDLEVVAKREDNDEVLFELTDGTLAVVHLTWRGQKEINPYPKTQLYRDKKDFWKQKLQKDIEELNK